MEKSYSHVKDSQGETSEEAKVIHFPGDVDFYYQKGNHYFLKNNFKKALLFFKKTVELEPDNAINHYNLACLLSKMGHLEEANQLFNYIVEELDASMSECFFLVAINYGLMDELEEAQKYLRHYLKNEPEGEMAQEAQELLWALDENIPPNEEEMEGTWPNPREENWVENREELLREIGRWDQYELSEAYTQNKLLQQVFKKILYHSWDPEKEEIIRLCGKVEHRQARITMLEFVRNPWVKDRLKVLALLKLKNMKMGATSTCQVYLKGKTREIDLEEFPLRAPRWEEKWERVLLCAFNQVRERAELNQEQYLQALLFIWLDFLNQSYPRVPKIVKPEVWAAGLEYSLAKHNSLPISQREISNRYRVSPTSVRNKYLTITQWIDLE